MSTEKGHFSTPLYSTIKEDNLDLQWPRSVQVYSKMAREDAQVRSILQAMTLPIIRTGWRIRPNGADPEIVKMVAEDLGLEIEGEEVDTPTKSKGKVDFKSHLGWALKSLVFGHMYFEKVYSDGSDGPQRLGKLAPRMPDTIHKINVAPDGGLESIEQKPPFVATGNSPYKGPITLEVGRLLVYLNDPQTSDWLGTSVLRAAYKHWVLKDKLLRLEASILERNGMGYPVYESSGNGSPKEQREEIKRGADISKTMRAGTLAGAGIPNGAKLSLLGVSGTTVSPREAINYHDSQIARTALAHALNLEGKGGSYALAEVQMELFLQGLQTIAEQHAAVANNYLVPDMVEKYTGQTDVLCPLVVFDTIGSKQKITVSEFIQAVQAKVIIMDHSTEEWFRRTNQIPAKELSREEVEQLISENKQSEAQQTPPPPPADENTQPPTDNEENP